MDLDVKDINRLKPLFKVMLLMRICLPKDEIYNFNSPQPDPVRISYSK